VLFLLHIFDPLLDLGSLGLHHVVLALEGRRLHGQVLLAHQLLVREGDHLALSPLGAHPGQQLNRKVGPILQFRILLS